MADTQRGAAVDIRSVTKTYGNFTALDDVSLRIEAGQFMTFLGPSGSGKTTTLNVIAGFTELTAGEILIGERSVGNLPAHKRNVGVVFQGVHLLGNATVRENVALPLRLARRPGMHTARVSREQEARAVEEIVSFVGLTHRIGHYPAQLSGGEQQRVALARALVGRPSLLLCDEPTSSLDTTTTAEVLRVLANARSEFGTTVVVVTHDLDVVKAICDRAALLERGVLCEVFDIATSGYRSLPSYREQVEHELHKPPTPAQDA